MLVRQRNDATGRWRSSNELDECGAMKSPATIVMMPVSQPEEIHGMTAFAVLDCLTGRKDPSGRVDRKRGAYAVRRYVTRSVGGGVLCFYQSMECIGLRAHPARPRPGRAFPKAMRWISNPRLPSCLPENPAARRREKRRWCPCGTGSQRLWLHQRLPYPRRDGPLRGLRPNGERAARVF